MPSSSSSCCGESLPRRPPRWRGRRERMIPLETLRAAPKVLLHDHLDGGLRPATVIELARDQGYAGLPTTDAQELGRRFHASAASGSLSLYLRGFVHTIAVMQTEEAVERVAHRIGHGVRRVEVMAISEDKVVKLGPLAAYVRDKRIPLELCPSSNVDTGAVPTLAEHPIRHFIAQRFRVTVNTDNRLMSHVTLSDEFQRLSRVAGLTLADVERLSVNAMKSAFVGYDERVAIIYARIKPGYARLRGEPALAGYPLPPTA